MSRDHWVTCVAWKKTLAGGAEKQVRETEGRSVFKPCNSRCQLRWEKMCSVGVDRVPCGKGSGCPESLKDLKQRKTGQTLHFRRTTGESEMKGVRRRLN